MSGFILSHSVDLCDDTTHAYIGQCLHEDPFTSENLTLHTFLLCSYMGFVIVWGSTFS